MQNSCPDLEETSGIGKKRRVCGYILGFLMFPLSGTKCSERGIDFWELPLTAFNLEQQSQFPTYPGTPACFPVVECVEEGNRWVSAL